MRNIVVTGGSRGIGLGIVRMIVASGDRAIAISRGRSAELDALSAGAADITQLAFRSFDLDNLAGISQLVKELRKEFGPIYGLVNNAGIGIAGLLATMRDREIERMTRINVTAPLTLTKYVVRTMMADGGAGRIVNIGSIVGATGYRGLAAYSATKAALTGFTRSLARELGPLNITVNTVAPGFIDTAMTAELQAGRREQIARRSALGRLPEISDVAHLVQFLLSAKARNITGAILTVDAGNTA